MIDENLDNSYKSLEHVKFKYKKAHMDLEMTKNAFNKKESDGTISRNELDKMKSLTNKKTR